MTKTENWIRRLVANIGHRMYMWGSTPDKTEEEKLATVLLFHRVWANERGVDFYRALLMAGTTFNLILDKLHSSVAAESGTVITRWSPDENLEDGETFFEVTPESCSAGDMVSLRVASRISPRGLWLEATVKHQYKESIFSGVASDGWMVELVDGSAIRLECGKHRDVRKAVKAPKRRTSNGS